MTTLRQRALDLHRESEGKIEVLSKVGVRTREDLSLAYTPGVAEACKEIAKDAELAYVYTSKQHMVAVISDGTAVLGLGDIGPAGAIPVMEGKALLFKHFGAVDAIPLCVATKNTDDIVQIVKWLEPSIGGVNLEDISAPRCCEIEERLKRETNIPIFHDDQHGTAVVVIAALENALKLVGKDWSEATIVINGAGAAGMSTCLLLSDLGVKNVILCDTRGAIYDGRTEGMNPYKHKVSRITNPKKVKGSLGDAMRGADAFVGLSAPGTVTAEMVSAMAPGAIVLAMANPVPEIYPDEAKKGGASVIGTGRSDFPNQVNNVLAFPGILRGALDARSSDINEAMKIAAAKAIAELVSEEELAPEYIIPDPFDPRVAPAVAAAVAQAAMDSGVARLKVCAEEVRETTRLRVERINSRA